MSKSNLNQYCQKSHLSTASYCTERRDDLFVSEVTVNSISFRSIEGHATKKEAENDAAAVALQSLVQLHPSAKSVDELLKISSSATSISKNKEQVTTKTSLDLVVHSKAQSEQTSPTVQVQSHPACATLTHTMATKSQVLVQPTSFSPPSQRPPPGIPIPGPPAVLRLQCPVISQIGTSGVHNSFSLRPPLVARPFTQMPPPGSGPRLVSIHTISASLPPHPILVAPNASSMHGSPLKSFPSPHLVLSPPIPGIRPTSMNCLPMLEPGFMPVHVPNAFPNRLIVTPPRYIPASPAAHAQLPDLHSDEQGPCTSAQHNFEKELERFCQLHNLSPPLYSISEKKGRFVARVKVDGRKYGGSRDYEAFEVARESATLIALACIGLQALKMGDRAAAPPTLSPVLQQQQQEPRQAQSPPAGIRRSCLWSNPQQLPPPLALEPSQSQIEASRHRDTEARCVDIQKHPPSVCPESTVVSVSVSPATQLQTPAFFGGNTTTGTSSLHPKEPPAVSSAHKTESASNSRATATVAKMSNYLSNYKVTLNLYCQKNGIQPPHYNCTYPEDAVGYIATVSVQGKVFTSNAQGTKRGAESKAAAKALRSFGVSVEEDEDDVMATNGHAAKGGTVEPPPSISATERTISFKNLLQEYLQKSHISELPLYDTERTEDGFVCTVVVKLSPDKAQHFKGAAHGNKKSAEQESAKVACYELKVVT